MTLGGRVEPLSIRNREGRGRPSRGTTVGKVANKVGASLPTKTLAPIRPDWIIVSLPTALALKNFHAGNSPSADFYIIISFAIVNLTLVAAAFIRPASNKFHTAAGPFVILIASSAIVLTRPSGIHNVALFILVSALTFQLVRTVDSRRIISSLIDGLGLYALVNVLLYAIGFRSATEAEGWRLALSSGGISRVIFPLDQSLNLPPVIAAIYIAAFYFTFREPGWPRRLFRLSCLIAALIMLIGSGTRVPAVVALVVPALALFIPTVVRWMAPAAVIFASASALILPPAISTAQSVLNPIVSFVSDRRDASRQTLAALNGRDYVWEHSLQFWREEVVNPVHVLVGYGLQGQYKSGASLTYYRILSHVIVRDPEKYISVHNSFLQQLFDGGLIGWLLLTLAATWASVRYSRRISSWGSASTAAVLAITVVMLCSMTEVLLHPTVLTFWILLILVGAACQSGGAADFESKLNPSVNE